MIYLDNAGTTKLSEKAKAEMLPYFDEIYGNASSLHTMGQIAKDHLEQMRERIANCIGATAREIYFTSGGTEGDNWAIVSVANKGAQKGKKHIITSAFEHHAVLHTLKALEKQGFTVTYLPVNENGVINPKDVENAICEQTCLVTIMYANNEIGTIQPIAEIGEICHNHNVVFHTDAVQAVGHIDIDVKKQNIDLMSVSGHKFHGPKGIGFLYAKTGIVLDNFMQGGAQEKNKRPGTENLANIVGMTVALEESLQELEQVTKKEIMLRDKLFAELSKIPHSKINGDTKMRLANNFNMSFEGIEGESLLLYLDDEGVCASSGSACTSGSLDPSHVLLSIGLVHEIAHGSLRLTLSKYTTEAEIDKVIECVPKIIERLRKMSPIWDAMEKGVIKHVI